MTMTAAPHANGRGRSVTLAPLRLPEHGPARPWPQQDDPGQARTPPDKPGRWRAIDGDTAIRVLAAIVVLAVAAFGAIVSYSHIYALGRAHGQDGTAARLLPLSVDGLIAAASLVMLHAARRELPVPRLARGMLITGVIATIAANILDGLPAAWISSVVSALIGAALSAWPAVAFIGCAEMVVQFVRGARHDAVAGQPVVTPPVMAHDDGKDGGPGRPPPPERRAGLTKQARAAAVIRDNPGLANAALAKLAGCDIRTISRARNGKQGA